MLRHTFCHIPGIGPRMEASLWARGITTWEELLAQAHLPGCYPFRRGCADHVHESVRQLAAGNPAYFAGKLASDQRWRLFHDFRGACAYLDIETTGLSPDDAITTIAVYDGRAVRTYVQGDNLDTFSDEVACYDLLITYNGSTFDLPFLERHFGRKLPQTHIDLRYLLASLGYRGGLKACERQLGIDRPGVEELDGWAAVLLWHEYRRTGCRQALETLLAYNAQDVLNLERLMVEAHNHKVARTPFAPAYALPVPCTRPNPFPVDAGLVERVCAGRLWRPALPI